MSLKIYNTLTKDKEKFVPIKEKEVGIYVCGITLYDDIHIGHLRNIVVFDLLRNYLESQGYLVKFVRNITDIDDKIIKKAKNAEQSPLELVNTYIAKFHQLLDDLKIRKDYIEPRVTEYLQPIIEYIQKLVDDQYAYVSEGSVYFLVKNEDKVYPLSKKKLKDMQDYARLADENTDKQNKSDFALWKKDEEFGFPSPWGVGRPGWHIECSVMHHHTLGQHFDIHGGGRDLVFPHHENEIVQSEAHNHQAPAKYWMHNGMMTITVKDANNKKIEQKISKSLGNSIYVKDLLEQYQPEALKYFLLKAHYRNNQDYNQKELESSQNFILKLESLVYFIMENQLNISIEEEETIDNQEFYLSLDDDLNTPKALAFINQKLNQLNAKPSVKKIENIFNLLKLLGVYNKEAPLEQIHHKHMAQQKNYLEKYSSDLQLRETYKQQGKWELADSIRQKIEKENIKIMDLPNNQYFFTNIQKPVLSQTQSNLKPKI